MSIESLTTFFGWCAVINIAILLISTVSLFALHEPAVRIHSKMFGMSEAELARA